MENEKETSGLPGPVIKFLVTMLSLAAISSVGALITTWNSSNLTKQRIDNVDGKYIVKSERIESNLNALTAAFGAHLTGDNEHQLIVQRQHLEFKNFMDMLDDAHEDIENNKQQIELMKQGCCIQNGGVPWSPTQR